MNGGCGSLWSRAHSVATVGEGPLAGDGLLTAISSCFFSSKQITSVLCFLFVGMLETFWLSFSFFLFKETWGLNWEWKGCEMLVSFCWGESEAARSVFERWSLRTPNKRWRNKSTTGWETETLKGNILQCGKVIKNCNRKALARKGESLPFILLSGLRVCSLFYSDKTLLGCVFFSSPQFKQLILVLI